MAVDGARKAAPAKRRVLRICDLGCRRLTRAIGLVGNSNSGFRFRKAPAVSPPTFQKIWLSRMLESSLGTPYRIWGVPLLEAPLIT